MKSVFLSIVILLLLLLFSTTTLSSDHVPIPYDNDNNYTSVVVVGCIASEREALLKFKHNLIDHWNFLGSWSTSAQDCCLWDGVICDDFTGHVSTLNLSIYNYANYDGWSAYYDGCSAYYDRCSAYYYDVWPTLSGKVSHSLLNLTRLKHLDLSYNKFEGQIPTFFGSMNSLRSLILSRAGFRGMIPHQLGNLSNLEYLHIKSPHSDYSYVESLHWLSGLHSLKYLNMEYVSLEKSQDWLHVTSTLPSLEELHLIECSLPNVELLHIANFSSLTVLDLSANFYINLSWVFDLTSLISLDLSFANLEGTVPKGLQNLTSLKHLDLSLNYFNSSIPNWFYNFCNLETLYLEHNYLGNGFDIISSSLIYNMSSLTSLDLSGNILDEGFTVSLGKLCNLKSITLWYCSLKFDISKVLKSFSGCASIMLESLDLSDNQLFGELSDEIGQFQNLITLRLSRNSLSGPIPSAIAKLSSLEYLYLFNNKFNGSFPILFPKLPNLQELEVSDNLLQGEVTENHFENATKLKALDISRNSLTLKLTSSWIPPFQLSVLLLQSCNLGLEFPLWISSQKYLHYLYMSSANLSGSVPTWFWNMFSQFVIVDISHNHFSGHIPSFDSNYLRKIDLSSNNFHGVLPHFLPSKYLTILDLSNNSLSGSMYHFLCGQSRQNDLVQLLLDGNNLSGELPDCWERWPQLSTLDLNNNNFFGNIPASMGKLIELRHLNLAHNKLSGGLPSSMSNCSNLEIIDVGYNQLVGSIPPWIGETPERLGILSLRSNKFENNIPDELCALVYLQVLDLANNSLSGAIPQCINNFSIMATETTDYVYQYSLLLEDIELMTKGVLKEYNSILQYVKALDISLNNLSGELPMELTTLQGLQYLNLSNNHFTGLIPTNIGMMDSLEALDLSSNKLSGEIPSSMSKLHFLSALNLSNNKLKGGIPLSTQMQSMPESSFVGNELCGLPLTKNCSSGTHDSTSVGENHQGKKKAELNLIYVGIVAGFILGFWGSIGSLLFSLPWRVMFFQFVDRIWLHVLFFIAKCRRFTLFQV